MIDADLLQSNYIGRDGFKWWIGQVADPVTSGWGDAKDANDKTGSAEGESKKYTRRCKVRILGYHTISDADGYVLKDSDLPWAHILVGPGEGTGIFGTGSTHQYKGGENVLGFFLDGDDAQQPVIMGGFSRFKDKIKDNKDNPETDPQTDCIIRPANPQATTAGTLKQIHLLEVDKDQSSDTPGESALTGQSTDSKSKSFASKVHAGEPGSKKEKQSNKENESYPSISRESSNQPGENLIEGIKSQLRGLLESLTRIQKYKEFYFDASVAQITTISNTVRGYSNVISGYVKKLLTIFNGEVLKGLSDTIQKTFGSIIPESIKTTIVVPVIKAAKSILCIVRGLFSGSKLLDLVNGIISGKILGNIIDNTLCAVEDLVTEIIDKVFTPIINVVYGTLNQLASIFGDASLKVGNFIAKISDTISFVLDLLNCIQTKTTGPPAKVWPPEPNEDNAKAFASALKKANLPEEIPLPERWNDLEQRSYSCDSNIGYYLPPILEILGDFVGIPVVGDDGKILSVYIKEPGRGYSPLRPPAISIIQPGVWGQGGGARGRAVINENDGSITDIIITNPGKGYTSQPFVAASTVGPEVPLNLLPLPRISEQINVLPYLDTLYVESPGVGYSSNDEIYINGKELSQYGIDYEIDVGPSGSIFSVNTDNKNNFPVIFNQYPSVSVISTTGVNAKISPNLNFFRLEEFVTDENGDITITDENFVRSQGPLQVKSDNLVKVVNCIRK